MRDITTAYLFGSSPAYDAFILAFRIPNLMRRLFAEGAFAQAFVPILSEYRVKESPQATKQLVNCVAGNLGLVLLWISILGVICAPWLAALFGMGFKSGATRLLLATDMLRITFPYIFFISLSALAGSILNAYGKFAIPAITPIFLNICMISMSILCANKFTHPEMALAWGVFLGGIVQLSFQLPFLSRIGFLPKLTINWQHPGVKRILILMVPALFGAAISQINILVDTIFASFLVSGSISWLYYADRLMEFPLGVFGVGLATVVLPNLSAKHALGENKDFSKILDWGIRWVLLIGVPATLSLYILAGPLLSTLFQSGKFNLHDVVMSHQSLQAYAGAVVGIMLAKVFASAFFAKQDIKTPVRISAIILLVNIILNSLLIGPLAHAGLALATSIASLINALLLFITIKHKHGFSLQAGWLMFGLRIILANSGLVGFLIYYTPDLSNWLEWSSLTKVVQLAFIVGGGVAIYSGLLFCTGLRAKHVLIKAR